MEILRLLSPLPGSVGAVVISLETDWRDSIGWDPELLQCERREVCHGTGLAPTHVLGGGAGLGQNTGVASLSHHQPSPPLLSIINVSILHSQLISSLKLKLLDKLEGRD